MDIQKNSSLKFKSNYSMSEITTDNNLNLGTLKTFNCQNVTSILNNPEVYHILYSSLSSTKSSTKSQSSEATINRMNLNFLALFILLLLARVNQLTPNRLKVLKLLRLLMNIVGKSKK